MAKLHRSPATMWGKAASAGLEAGLSVAIGGFLGYHADRWLGTEPWLLLAFLILGFAAGMRRLFQMTQVSWVPDEASSSRSAESSDSASSSEGAAAPGAGRDDESSP